MKKTQHYKSRTNLPRAGCFRAATSGLRWLALVIVLGLGAGWPAVSRAVNLNEIQEQVQEADRPQTTVDKQKEEQAKRIWFFDGIFETHWIVVRDNLAANDVYNILYLRGNVDVPRLGRLPPLGRFGLRMDLTGKYIADPEESGILIGDLRLEYSYPFSFSIKNQAFGGRGYFYWTFPTSKISRQEGNISRPTLLFALTKELPLGFTALVHPFFRLNWAKYAEKEGGNPNAKWYLGYDLQLLYTFPYHQPLSFGGTFAQAWTSRYSTRDGYDQPWNSEYYWEVFSSYSVLTKPAILDVTLALASGRKTFEDGVWRFYFVERDETEMYLSISARY